MCLFFKTGFLCVVLAILELALLYTRLALNSEICLPLPLECTDWIKGVCQHRLKKLCFNINFHMAKWQIQGFSKHLLSSKTAIFQIKFGH